jgi:NADH dehydrogenase FAD-containing subunit
VGRWGEILPSRQDPGPAHRAELDPIGRVKVTPDLTVPGHPNLFVIGDLAHVEGADGKPLPGLAGHGRLTTSAPAHTLLKPVVSSDGWATSTSTAVDFSMIAHLS